jgi:flavin reductase (DIM6/NTAB) family NADH-FMN oxidoreductase RutF
MTVNSYTSLSLHPPLVLISLEKGTRTHKLLLHSGIFGVTILSREPQELSDRFAGRQTDDQDRFEGLETFTLQTGAPFLSGGLAYFDCRVIHRHEAATHHVFFGEVVQVQFGEAVEPLLYFDRISRFRSWR